MNAYRNARHRAEVSQTETAAKTGLSKDAISRIERGKRRPNVETAAKLADAYGISLDELTGRVPTAS